MKRVILILYLLVLLLTIGCDNDETIVYQVDPRLEKYVQLFYSEAAKHNKSIPKNNLIILVTKDLLATEEKHAVSRNTSGDQVKIEVDEALVNGTDTLFLEFAMMHEFGHGFLRRGHTTEYSIMNPHRRTVAGYKRNVIERGKLLNELFQ
jgi:hypothetical protein